MNLREINQVYNSFSTEGRDMSRESFIKKMQDLTSQAGVNRDLGKIIGMKQTEATQKLKIDEAVRENG